MITYRTGPKNIVIRVHTQPSFIAAKQTAWQPRDIDFTYALSFVQLFYHASTCRNVIAKDRIAVMGNRKGNVASLWEMQHIYGTPYRCTSLHPEITCQTCGHYRTLTWHGARASEFHTLLCKHQRNPSLWQKTATFLPSWSYRLMMDGQSKIKLATRHVKIKAHYYTLMPSITKTTALVCPFSFL